ncbi:MAG: hypothetical protein ACOC8B_04080, partial [Gemmatimonadota bacterium]
PAREPSREGAESEVETPAENTSARSASPYWCRVTEVLDPACMPWWTGLRSPSVTIERAADAAA